MKSTNILMIISLMVLLVLASFGCSLEKSSQVFINDITIQGMVYNGITGEAVADVTITFSNGTESISVTSDATGTYQTTGAPAGNVIVTASATGFFTIEDVISIWETTTYQNIFMFPEGNVADLTLTVVDDLGRPLADASVRILLSNAGNVPALLDDYPTANGDDILLQNSEGVTKYAMQELTTDANGVVTITGASLIDGATYEVYVTGAVNAEGVELDLETDTFVAGSPEAQDIYIELDNPGIAPLAIKANNEEFIWEIWDAEMQGNPPDFTDVETNDSLIITFQDPIEICSNEDNHTWSNRTNDVQFDWYEVGLGWHVGDTFSTFQFDNTDGDDIEAAATTDDEKVTTSVSTDGYQLTLTPVFGLEADGDSKDADDNLIVRFDNIGVRVQGPDYYPCYQLGNVILRDNTNNDSKYGLLRYLPVELSQDEAVPVSRLGVEIVPGGGGDNSNDSIEIHFRAQVEVCSDAGDHDATVTAVEPGGGNGTLTTLNAGSKFNLGWTNDWFWHDGIDLSPNYSDYDGEDAAPGPPTNDDTSISIEYTGIQVQAYDGIQGDWGACVNLDTVQIDGTDTVLDPTHTVYP
jgi:hypothetical protein